MSRKFQSKTKAKSSQTFAPAATGLLQRKCACGGNAGLDGECVECRQKRLSRKTHFENATEPQTVPPIVHEVLRSPGQPLDAGTREFMESRFGHDFSRVLVHTDSHAAESAKAVNALAYTVGRHVVFGTGQHAPASSSGQRLLAHELTHVVQQWSLQSPDSKSIEIGPANNAMEKQANQAALSITGNGSNSTPANIFNSPKVALQRQIPSPPFTTNRQRMENWAIHINTNVIPGWRNVLPDCPCTDQDARSNPQNWQGGIGGCPTFFHPGAATGYRSTRGFTSIAGTSHGQQCCYDNNGQLMTGGPGAGTPDLWSPVTNSIRHQQFDVIPWFILGSPIYNKYWVPNKAPICRAGDFPAPPENERIV